MSAKGWNTAITRLFNVKYPIILPGMSWVSVPRLVARFQMPGVLDCWLQGLITGPLTAKETKESIDEIRRLTDKPFGINTALIMPGSKENVEVALEEKVPVINISLGKGDWVTERAHSYGGKVIATVTTEKHARAAVDFGADCLMVTGHEAAAHGGEVTSMCLVPYIISKVAGPHGLPVICAGGVGDGRGIAAAFALGAEGVAMGTRFALSSESPIPNRVKTEAIARSVEDTVYGSNFDGIPARIMKTEAAISAMAKPMNPIKVAYESLKAAQQFNVPLWKVLPGMLVEWQKIYMLANFGASTSRLTAASIHGDLDYGIQFIGQCQGLITDIRPVEDIIHSIVKEAEVANMLTSDRFSCN